MRAILALLLLSFGFACQAQAIELVVEPSVALSGAEVSLSAIEQAQAQPSPTPSPDPAPMTTPPLQPGGGQEILVEARTPSPADPIEAVNVESFKAVQAVDQAIVAPIAAGYVEAAPKPLRKGLHNVLGNLNEPVVFLNFLLQFKPGKAAETLGRFVTNSTVGIGGLFDVARKKPFNLPRRPNGLANTLGFYGVKPGAYLFLPLIGPTTVRDVIARPFDLALLPFLAPVPFGDPAVALGKAAISTIDDRAYDDRRIRRLRDETPDGYVAIREDYLRRRQNEIDVLKGRCRTVDDPPCGPYVPRLMPMAPVAPDQSQGDP